MNIARTVSIACLFSVAGLASTASGQFLTSITEPGAGDNPGDVYFVDTANAVTPNEFLLYPADGPPAGPGLRFEAFSGLAGDDDNRRFFALGTADLFDTIYEFSYDDLLNPTPVAFLNTGDPDDLGDNGVFDPDVFLERLNAGVMSRGLAYVPEQDTLYIVIATGSNTAEGIFSVNTDTGVVTLEYEFSRDITGSVDVTAIDYDPGTGLLYFVNNSRNSTNPDDPSDSPFRAIWTIDPTTFDQAEVFIAFNQNVDNFDGLAAGMGQLLLVTDAEDVNGGEHLLIDIASRTLVATIDSPYPVREPFGDIGALEPGSGAAFVPNLRFGPFPVTDVNIDGAVNFIDVITLDGRVDDGSLAGDLNDDDATDLEDISFLLAAL